MYVDASPGSCEPSPVRQLLAFVAVWCAAPGPAWGLTFPVEGSLPGCSASLEVMGGPALVGPFAECRDGDRACDLDATADGACTFGVRACVHRTEDGCAPAALTRLKLGPTKLARQLGDSALDALAQAGDETCSERIDARAGLRRGGAKPSKPVRLALRARTDAGKGRATTRLRCLPRGDAPPSCAGGTPSGAPASLRLAVRATGSDLDLGWTGQFHSMPLPAGPSTTLCLSGCDATGDALCDVSAVPDTAGAPRGLGAPMPMHVAGVPVCAVSRITGPGSGTFDLDGGALDAVVPAAFELHSPTPFTEICPRCSAVGGATETTCSSSAERAGEPCVVEATVRVEDSGGDEEYGLSRDCLPTAPSVGTVALELPLTTATSSLTGAAPLCAGAGGLTPMANACANGACGATCAGDSCEALDDEGRCLSRLGGIAQACCATASQNQCFAGSEIGAITRTGTPAGALTPPWPEPTYPKTGALVAAGAVCFAGVESNQVNLVSGLPGPAAVLVPFDVTVETAP